MKKARVKWTALVCTLLLACGCMPAGAMASEESQRVISVEGKCSYYTGNNVNKQNYSVWSDTVDSALVKVGNDQYMRFQADADSSGYLVEYYDTDFHPVSSRVIEKELPIYGAFYDDGTHYYVLSGQNNESEDNEKEVFRLTQYDHNWNRISSTGLNGANTVHPFAGGSARITHDGSTMFIRTCHEMYKASDGYNHQANVMMEVNTDSMQVLKSQYAVANIGVGYVSHSFNQFVQLDGGYVLGVDHGDAYPRKVSLVKYRMPYTGSSFSMTCSSVSMLDISGGTGVNATGVSVGGFEVSSSSYLVVGNTVQMGEGYSASATRNIFVSTVDKGMSSDGTIHYITDYAAGESSPSTPHLVKISDSQFMLLWMKDNALFYTMLDGEGQQTTPIYSMDARLSDCAPIVNGSKVIWYTWQNEITHFYTIDVNEPTDTREYQVVNGHKYEVTYAGNGNNVASRTCSVCGKSDSFTTLTQFSLWFWKGWTGSSGYSASQNEGDDLAFSLRSYAPSDVENREIEVLSSDESIARVSMINGDEGVEFIGAGEVTVTIRAKYNPDVKREITLIVSHVYDNPEGTVVKEPTCSEAGEKQFTCTVCGQTISEEIAKTEHTVVQDPEVKATCSETGLTAGSHCSVCNEILSGQEVIEKLPHTEENVPGKEATCTEPGTTEGKICSICGEVLVEQEPIEAKGHSWNEALTVDQEATCTSTGSGYISCKVCGAAQEGSEQEIPILPHEEVIDSAKEATCSSTGLTEGKHCAVCGEILISQEETPVKEHTFSEWESVEASSCTGAGSQKRTCSSCLYTETTETNPNGHTWETEKTVDLEPTCTTAGSKSTHCMYCSMIKDSEVIDPLEHDWAQETTVDRKSTCQEKGQESIHCMACDAILKGSERELELADHVWNEGIIVTKPTYEQEGVKEYTCQVCNETRTETVPVLEELTERVLYRTHVQTYGWQGWKEDGQMSGTSGQSKRLEGIEIKIEDQNVSGGITYRTHVQTYGWQSWKSDGKMSGTSGESKRLEAIQIKLTGDLEEIYDIYYRVHAQTYGWLGWAKNGGYAGTSGLSKRLEGIQIVLVKKGDPAPGNVGGIASVKAEPYVHAAAHTWDGGTVTTEASCTSDGVIIYTCTECGTTKTAAAAKLGHNWETDGDYKVCSRCGEKKEISAIEPVSVNYRTHVQTYGWQGYVSNGALSGTTGLGKRLETIEIQLDTEADLGITYRTHCQTYGWRGWSSDGAKNGTVGESKRLEAIEIKLTGSDANNYDVYYRVHAQHFGWMGWAMNGERSGTAGYAYRLEAIQIVVVPKGEEIDRNMGGITSAYTATFMQY